MRLTPNDPSSLHIAARAYMHLGDFEKALAIWRKASELDPSPPPWTFWTAMNLHHQRGDLDIAYDYVLRLKHEAAGWHWVPATEAMVLADLDRMGDAKVAIAEALSLKPDLANTARSELEVWWWAVPDYIDRMMESINKAGLERAG